MMMRRMNWIVAWAVVVHLVWGMATLLGGGGVTAPNATLTMFFRDPLVEATVYFFVAGLAIAGCKVGLNEWRGMMLCVPQMIVLWASGESSLMAVVQGHYPDGTIRPMLFILRDQMPCIAGELAYSCALFPLADRKQVAHGIHRAAMVADHFAHDLMRAER